MPVRRRSARNSACTSLRVIASSAPNGSSSSTMRGPAASARAKATRCRCPPESWCGQRAPNCAGGRPTLSSAAAARAALSARPGQHGHERHVARHASSAAAARRPAARSRRRGAARPDRRARRRARRRVPRRRPARVSALKARSSVLLPEPLSPTSATHSPCATASDTSSSAVDRAEPLRHAGRLERQGRHGLRSRRKARARRLETRARRLRTRCHPSATPSAPRPSGRAARAAEVAAAQPPAQARAAMPRAAGLDEHVVLVQLTQVAAAGHEVGPGAPAGRIAAS